MWLGLEGSFTKMDVKVQTKKLDEYPKCSECLSSADYESEDNAKPLSKSNSRNSRA